MFGFVMRNLLAFVVSLAWLAHDGEAQQQQQQQQHAQPVKVFILAGQSNMVGMGSVHPHLDILVNDTTSCSCCNPYRKALWNGTNYKVRQDGVYIKFNDRMGPLTVGFGVDENRFGPELMFGWVLGDTFHEKNHHHQENSNNKYNDGKDNVPIYLIKTAWGGEDLAVAFRPPRSGEGKYENVRPSHYGYRYRDMVTGVQEGLDQIADVIPYYNETIGYEISGLLWFQGWNDMLEYDKVHEYAFNLANFVRDVADEWQTPGLPVIIGELGMHGVNVTGQGADRIMAMRQAEREVPSLPEFRNRSLFVPTACYAVLNGTTYNGQYHYNGRADTYFHIGKAMGEGMIKLLDRQKATSNLRGAASPIQAS